MTARASRAKPDVDKNTGRISPPSLAGPKGNVEIGFDVTRADGLFALRVVYAISRPSSGGPPPYVFTAQTSPAELQSPSPPVAIDKDKGTVEIYYNAKVGPYSSGSLTIERLKGGSANGGLGTDAELAIGIQVYGLYWVWNGNEWVSNQYKTSADTSCRLAILPLKLKQAMASGEDLNGLAQRIKKFMGRKKGAVGLDAIKNLLNGVSGTLPDTQALYEKFVESQK